jgi:hypothetical protein
MRNPSCIVAGHVTPDKAVLKKAGQESTIMQRELKSASSKRMQHLFRMLGLLLASTAASCAAWAQQASASPTVSKIEVEVLHLGRDACLPEQSQRPQGQFRLLVINQTGISSLQFSLQAAGAQTAQSTKQFSTVDRYWAQLLDLPSGQYTISSPGDTQHVCTIVIK